jgi:hypothetical protein
LVGGLNNALTTIREEIKESLDKVASSKVDFTGVVTDQLIGGGLSYGHKKTKVSLFADAGGGFNWRTGKPFFRGLLGIRGIF